jgi:tRNA-specific 2-thiouridylase
LPLGSLDKAATRAHALRLGLPVHDKPESQDICFVEGGDYREVLARIRPQADTPGEVVSTGGAPLGTHRGIVRYTVGQRAGVPPSADGPRYVARIDAERNTIVVGRQDELLSSVVHAQARNLIRPERFNGESPVLAMIRYRCVPAPARVRLEGAEGMVLRFETAVRAVAPGQLVALFDPGGQEVLGAGTIARAVA